MIQVDLSVLVSMFYLLGQASKYPDPDTSKMFNALDKWQRDQLSEAWRQGKAKQKLNLYSSLQNRG